jgi:hypothetical protein
VTDEIGRSGSQRREETAPAGRAIPTNNADGGGANIGHSGAEGDCCKNLFKPKAKRAAATFMHGRALGLRQQQVCRSVELDRNTLGDRNRQPGDPGLHTRIREIVESNRRHRCTRILCAVGLGWVEGASQEGRANLSAQRALIAAPSPEESRSGLCVMLAAQPARALSCDELCP